ncbi:MULTISPECIES: hypothetical protein [unclassified Clostridium]|uniref:hypothetical protein n=1 Tax=unclassified Clostridium TaxID=2614128 RepID=UPI0025C231EB|nr:MULTISPECIES: hypothetical protein [unclassified Clostridium]
MNIVYVIYFDGKIYKTPSRKTAYLEKKYAKQVVTVDSKDIAADMYHSQGQNKNYWDDLSKEERETYMQKAKKRFEIREFVERS